MENNVGVEIINMIVKLFNGHILTEKEEVVMQDLTGYKAEAPEENSNNPFSYKGKINMLITEKCKGAWVKVVDEAKTTQFSVTNIGDKFFSVSFQVPEDAKENAKRTLFKSWNLDSNSADAKGKTPAMKLADWLNPKSTGLVLSNEESLRGIAQRLLDEPWDVNFWVIKIGDKEIQMSKLEKAGKFAGQSESGFGNSSDLASKNPFEK